MYKKIFSLPLIDLDEIYPVKPPEFENSFSVESNDNKTAQNC